MRDLTAVAGLLGVFLAWPAAADALADVRAIADPAQKLQKLLDLEVDYAGEADYDVALGQTALEAGQPLLAEQAFERLALLHPEQAGAWLDWALTQEAMGDQDGARETVTRFRQTYLLPSGLEPTVQQLEQRLGMSATSGGLRWQGDYLLTFGSESNANGGLGVDSLDLHLGDGIVTLPLDPAFRPRADTYQELALEGRAEHAALPLWQFRAALRVRRYQQETQVNLNELVLSAQRRVPMKQGEGYLEGSWQRLDLGGHQLYTTTSLGAGWERGWGAGCSGTVSTQLDNRRYATLTTLDGDIVWLGAGLACRRPAPYLPTISLALRRGRDLPQGERAGGANTSTEANLSLQWLPARTHRLVLALQKQRLQDDAPYSPLFGPVRRQLDQQGVRAEWQWAWQSGYTLALGVQQWRQQANLSLFEQSNRTLSLSLSGIF